MSGWRRVIFGALILLGGLAVAFCFRKDSAHSGQGSAPLATGIDGLERRTAGDLTGNRQILESPARQPSYRIPAAATGVETPPPELPPIYHRTHSPIGALLNSPSAAPVDASAAGGPAGVASQTSSYRQHTIADGDTLSKLATEYLGSGERFLEIFELNRDVLASPDLLPIGATIKLPPPGAPAAPSTSATSGGAAPSLVPIPPGALRQ